MIPRLEPEREAQVGYAANLAVAARREHCRRMDRRQRRSRDRRTALHLFLESQRSKLDARSLRVTTLGGEVVAGVGEDVYADDWVATWTLRVDGEPLVVAASGGRTSDDIGLGVRRIMG
jgi:hypothetical protein